MDTKSAQKLYHSVMYQRRKRILEMYKKGLTLQEIAYKEGVTRQRIHAILETFNQKP